MVVETISKPCSHCGQTVDFGSAPRTASQCLGLDASSLGKKKNAKLPQWMVTNRLTTPLVDGADLARLGASGCVSSPRTAAEARDSQRCWQTFLEAAA